MSSVTTTTIEILQYLLPGFLCAWIFYSFTSHEKPQQLEQLIQALIFTLVIQVAVVIFKYLVGIYSSCFVWEDSSELVLSTASALFMGFLFAAFANNDWFHKIVRWFRISTETSYPSEWYGELSSQKHFVVLHLDGERRLYGWPKEWPSSPDTGHFAIVEGEWLVDETEQTPAANEPVTRPDVVLVRASDVEMIEFVKPT